MKKLNYALILCALIRVAEEYTFGWVEWATRFVPGVTSSQFFVVNALFIGFLAAAMFIGKQNPVVTLSAYALVGINALIHIGGFCALWCYNPGTVSALICYVPLVYLAFYHARDEWSLTTKNLFQSVGLGLVWMSIPFLFQGIRLLSR